MTTESNIATNYNKMTDEGIIEEIKHGDRKALDYIMNKYADLVNMKASKFFIVGAEKGDIIQEGLKIQGHHNREENHKKVALRFIICYYLFFRFLLIYSS